MGISAIILAVLLANIPFPSEAEGDDAISGNDPTASTESEEVTYEISLEDSRSDLMTASKVSFSGTLSKNLTVSVSGQEITNTGSVYPEETGYASGRYLYQKITVNVTDTDAGTAVSDYGTMTVNIGLPNKMKQDKGTLKVYNESGTLISDSTNLGSQNFRITLNNAESAVCVLQYYGFITNSVAGNVVTTSATFENPNMYTDWYLTVERAATTELQDLLDADPSIQYTSRLLLDITVKDAYNVPKLGPGAFSTCTLTIEMPDDMPLSGGTVAAYTIKNGSLEQLSVTKANSKSIRVRTTHFSEYAILYTKNPDTDTNNNSNNNNNTNNNSDNNTNTNTGNPENNESQNTGNNDSGNNYDDHQDDRDDDPPAVIQASETETETETTETEPVVVTDTTIDTGAGIGNTEITMNSGNKGAGRKNVDMPKTGDADTYRYVGVLMLLFFGIFELISSIPAGRRRTAGR